MYVFLGKYKDVYEKGIVCESQGYGIGAYAYYRRIAEELTDDLLESIEVLMPEHEKANYKQALLDTKKETNVAKKIELVKDLLPASLKPENINPLNILYKSLSIGIHAKADEECLEIAGEIREFLIYLLHKISLSKEADKKFSLNMKKILDKRNK